MQCVEFVSRQDYLVAERQASSKHEWVAGHVYPRACSSKQHAASVTQLVRTIAAGPEQRGCLLGSNDLMVQTENANYYPDVVVSCDPTDDPYIEHRPCFIAEVLSPTTSRTDRHEKRLEFQSIESMSTYWIVDPDAGVVEVWQRTADGWQGSHHRGDDLIEVHCLDVAVRVCDVVVA